MKNRVLIGMVCVLFAGTAWAQWNIQTVDDAGVAGEYGKKVVIDESGLPHIFYWCNDSARYAVWNGSNWRLDCIFRSYGSGGGVTGNLGSDGRPHIAGYGTGWYLLYAVKSDSVWQLDTIAYYSNSYTRPTDLLVDEENNPHVFAVNNGDVRHYWLLGTNWLSELLVDGVPDWHASATMDDSGRTYLAYSKNTQLLLLIVDGTERTTYDIDSVDATYPSVKISSDGSVGISYYDATNGDLKYAIGTPAERK